MVRVIEPKIGETIYDGACGSAGFLCEAFDYLKGAVMSRVISSTPSRPKSGETILDVPR